MLSSQLVLSKPAVRAETAGCSFNHTAPSVWNCLPITIQIPETARQFRAATRTHYYTDLLLIVDHATVSAPTIRPSNVDLGASLKTLHKNNRSQVATIHS